MRRRAWIPALLFLTACGQVLPEASTEASPDSIASHTPMPMVIVGVGSDQ